MTTGDYTSTIHTIVIKTPNKFVWTLLSLIVLGGYTAKWWTEVLSDLMFTIITMILLMVAIYSFYLFYKFYSKSSVRKITVNEVGETIITYQKFRNNSRNESIRDYEVSIDNIKLKVQKNHLWLLEKDKPIAKIYKNTLLDKKDWEWMIGYYKE